MENTRIGKLEAISFLITIMSNHVILNISKSIISSTSSSALINTIYISIIALILSYIIYILLNKFPTFDILDISNFLGGKTFKCIIGFLFCAYFIFFSATLLKNFIYCLQIIYYPNTNTFSLLLLFFIGAFFICNLKYNSLYRSNLLTIPFVILSIFILFLGNLEDFSFENIFPILGNGIDSTFLYGTIEIIAFENVYMSAQNNLIEENVVLIEGRLSIREDEATKIVASKIINFEDKKTKTLHLNITTLSEVQKDKLRGAIKFFNGERNNIPVVIEIGKEIKSCGQIYCTDEILKVFEEIVGEENVKII